MKMAVSWDVAQRSLVDIDVSKEELTASIIIALMMAQFFVKHNNKNKI
jgi:hypothetical protein